VSSNDPTYDPLEIVLSKLAEAGKLPASAIDSIYNGKIKLQIAKELGKTLDDFREGKIDKKTLDTIQESLYQYAGGLKGATKQKRTPQGRITSKLLDRIRQRTNLLYYLRRTLPKEFDEQLPFKDKLFLIILHFTIDLIPFLEVCESLGLNPNSSYLFYKPYLYPHKDQIINYLIKQRGYNISSLEELETVLGDLSEEALSQPLVVVEDGGYIIPLLHKKFPSLLKQCIGGVEQTTRGVRNDKALGQEISVPVMSVAESKLKGSIEPPHVADAVIRNIENLIPFEKIRGESVAIMGYGYIGKEIAARLQNRITTIIFDPRADKRLEAKDKGFTVVKTADKAVKERFMVIGCSGETSIGRNEIVSLSHPTYLVSATSDQKEIGIIELQALSSGKSRPLMDNKNNITGTSYTIGRKRTEVCLIADGYPVNFWSSESMPDLVSSLILSLIFVSTIELIQEHESLSPGINVEAVDNCAEKYNLAEIYEDLCS